MEDFEALVIFSGGEIVTLKNFGFNVRDVIDNLIQMNEIANIIQVTRLSDERIWDFRKKEIDLKALRKVRQVISDEVTLKRELRDFSDENL